MSYIFSSTEISDTKIRLTAGYQLKNSMHLFPHLHIDVQLYIENNLIKTLFENIDLIRKTSATVISSIICRIPFDYWPNLADILLQAAQSDNPLVVESSFDTLYKIMEDRPEAYNDSGNDKMLLTFIPIWIKYMTGNNNNLKKFSLLLLEGLLESDNYHTIFNWMTEYIQV